MGPGTATTYETHTLVFNSYVSVWKSEHLKALWGCSINVAPLSRGVSFEWPDQLHGIVLQLLCLCLTAVGPAAM